MKKQRLDVALVERGMVETRTKAQSLIMARRVLVNGQHVDKAGATVADDDELRIEELEHELRVAQVREEIAVVLPRLQRPAGDHGTATTAEKKMRRPRVKIRKPR